MITIQRVAIDEIGEIFSTETTNDTIRHNEMGIDVFV